MKQIAGFLLSMLCVAGLACGTTYANPPAHAGQGGGKGHTGDFRPGKPNKPDKPNKSNRGNKHEASASHTGNGLRSAGISALTARELAMQGGWTGYAPLPPGIAKNLARGKALPPGIAKKAVPGVMLAKLPSYPGYTWYAVGKDLMLISAAGMVIADVLHNVFD